MRQAGEGGERERERERQYDSTTGRRAHASIKQGKAGRGRHTGSTGSSLLAAPQILVGRVKLNLARSNG